MNRNPKFGHPVILKKLEEAYGSDANKTNITFRESKDVSVFLKEKAEAERKSSKEKIVFK